jgi:hypothetical protein
MEELLIVIDEVANADINHPNDIGLSRQNTHE